MVQDILQKNKEVREKKIEVLKKRQGKEKENKEVSGHYDTNRITNQVPTYSFLMSSENILQSNRYTITHRELKLDGAIGDFAEPL